jgi:glutathione-regulated potassium-efflux system ancillary protein KefG
VRDVAEITLHDLYEAYPTFHIDVDHEQKLLLHHDLIVLQHPFYWYSTPPIIKQWEDLVLEHGWAYGSKGNALREKQVIQAITVGGGLNAYQREGHNRFTIREFLAPIEQTFVLCKMRYLSPFAICGTHRMETPEIEAAAGAYQRFLVGLRDEHIDMEAMAQQSIITPDLVEHIMKRELAI